MGFSKLAAQETLHIQAETTYGTAPSEGSAPYTLLDAYDVELELPSSYTERPGMAGSGNYGGMVGPHFGGISFKTHLFGTAGNSYAALLFPSVGLILSGSDYVPIIQHPEAGSASTKGLCLRFNEDGDLHLVNGAMGTFELDGTAGDFVTMAWTFKGKYTAPSAQTRPAYTIPTASPIVAAGATLAIGGYSPMAAALKFTLGATITERTSIAASNNGAAGCYVVGFKPRLQIEHEAPLASAYDPIGDMLANPGALRNITAVFGASGNQVTLDFNKARVAGVGRGNRNGTRTYTVDFEPCRADGSGGDDWGTFTLG